REKLSTPTPGPRTSIGDSGSDGEQPVRDSRPTIADLLRQQDHVRRDNVAADANRRRVETPKPLAIDIEAIERQYAAGSDWSTIAASIGCSRPYALPRAKFDMVIDTGRAFAKTPLQKIMAALVGKNHGNAVLDQLYAEFLVGQVSKMPGGNLRMKLKTRDACLKLECTTVSILGGVYPFKPFDVLANKFFIDVASIDSNTDTDQMLECLFLLGCQPVYDSFRDVNLATGLTSATWRVYFRSEKCPPSLLVNGSVCDQIVFDHRLHPVHGKDAPFQSERLPFGFRSSHGIDLGTIEAIPLDSSKTKLPKSKMTKTTAKSTLKPAQAGPAASPPQKPRAGPVFSSLRTSLEREANGESQLQIRAPHGGRTDPGQLAKRAIDIDDALSIATLQDSSGRISPPASPTAKTSTTLLLTDGFTMVENRKKRGRGGVDFTSMLTKHVPRPLDGTATKNYFAELQTVSATFESFDATADVRYGARHQIVPVDVKIPDRVKTSTEAAFFVEKHHTKVRKSKRASPVAETVEAMQNDENTALLNTLEDKLVDADTKVDGITSVLENAANPDNVLKKAAESPLAFNSALSLKMSGNGSVIAELAQLHLINRVLSATSPDEDLTFAAKWKKLTGTSVPSKRQDLFKACAKWWTATDQIFELSRLTKALSVFELALMSAAPTIFLHDHWIQFVTGEPVQWVPAHHVRLLHPNTLLKLLRTDLGSLMLKQWRLLQWQGSLLDELEELRVLDGEYPDDESVVQLQVDAPGQVTLVAGGVALRG
ncbi:hypothetical protein PybrP1_008978, partial [[Pythium] brassicae (nom. inval.)]